MMSFYDSDIIKKGFDKVETKTFSLRGGYSNL